MAKGKKNDEQKRSQSNGGGEAAGGEAKRPPPLKKQPLQQQPKKPLLRNSDADAAGPKHYRGKIQVLAFDVDHNTPSVMLVVDKAGKYIFNAGEGVQRLIRENKVRLQKLDHYLFTRVDTETMAGFPGMLLSTGSTDAGGLLRGQETYTVVGPIGIGAYIDAFSPYINNDQRLKIIQLTCAPHHDPPPNHPGTFRVFDEPVSEDSYVTIKAIVLRPAAFVPSASSLGGANKRSASSPSRLSPPVGNPSSAEGSIDQDVAPPPSAKKARSARSPSPTAAKAAGSLPSPSLASEVVQKLSSSSSSWLTPEDGGWTPASELFSVCYVCEMGGIPGKFDPKKAEALGVFGRARGDLQRGQSVTLDNGRVILPEEVVEPTVPGPLVVIVDCPSIRHLRILKGEGQSDGSQGKGALAAWTEGPAAEAANAAAVAEAEAGRGGGEGEAGVSGGSEFPRYQTMVHMSPPRIVASSEYQAWITSLGPAWNHILCPKGADHDDVTMRKSAALQAKLNCLHPTLFPFLQNPSTPVDPPLLKLFPMATFPKPPVPPPPAAAVVEAKGTAVVPDASTPALSTSLPSAPVQPKLVIAPNCMNFNLLPLKGRGVDCSEINLPAPASEIQDQFRQVAGEIIKQAEEAAAAGTTTPDCKTPECLRGVERNELEVVFLGTVSSVPSTLRNVTSIYLDRFHRGGMLLDCGEDTFGQLKRRYGGAEAERQVCELACIWISHMHADHHGGLYRLLQLRGELLMKRQRAAEAAKTGRNVSLDPPSRSEWAKVPPILVMGPLPLFHVMAAYREILRIPYHFLASQDLIPGKGRPIPDLPRKMYDEAVRKLDLQTIQPFLVKHIGQSYGMLVEGRRGWKVAFSGDTQRCDSLVEATKGATLLIHEATFEIGMEQEAKAKHHSTTGDALAASKAAGVYRTILTHFSTRYPTLPEAFDTTDRKDVAVAMDFMSVNLADLEWLPGTIAPLDALFKKEKEGWEEDETKAMAPPV